MKKLNQKGFSLIELLAVVVILGILMGIGIPLTSRIVADSRKDAYINVVKLQQKSIENVINSEQYYVYDTNTVYYFDYRLGNEEDAAYSPYGEWNGAYVVVTYDGKKLRYYWTGIDTAYWKIDLKKEVKNLARKDVYNMKSSKVNPGATIGGRDNIVIYSFKEDTKEETTTETGVSNEVTYEEAIQCYTLKELTDNTYSIIDYNAEKCGTEANVPSRVDGKAVTIIGENAFKGKGLTKVTLYYGITKLENGAFQNNNISELKLSSSITEIGPFAFCSNKLTKIDLPEGLAIIRTYGFANNQLTEVSFPKTLTKIESYAFYNNLLKDVEFHSNPSIGGGSFARNQMPPSKGIIYLYDSKTGKTDYSTIVGYGGESKDVVIPEMVNGIALKTIASSAFASNGLKSVVIPDTVETISSSAFYSNTLTSVTLPSHLKTIGASAFRENWLTSIEIPPSVTSIGNGAFVRNCFPAGEDIIYARKSTGEVDYSTIASGAGGRSSGASCKGNLNLVIPAEKNGVKLKKINDSAFTCCYYKSVTFPDLDQTDNLSVGINTFYHNNFADGWMYRINNGSYDYTTLMSFGAAARTGTRLVIPGEKNGEKLKTIAASFTWLTYEEIEIPESVENLPDRKLAGIINSTSAIFSKSNSNNPKLRKIINKTGKAFDWYYLTGSTHTKPKDKYFVTGTVSHQSGDIEITDH